jgi:hypothetical protein
MPGQTIKDHQVTGTELSFVDKRAKNIPGNMEPVILQQGPGGQYLLDKIDIFLRDQGRGLSFLGDFPQVGAKIEMAAALSVQSLLLQVVT